jgi:hypothetical protein
MPVPASTHSLSPGRFINPCHSLVSYDLKFFFFWEFMTCAKELVNPLEWSLNALSTARGRQKCIFALFSRDLHLRAFTVTFLASFLVLFYNHFAAKITRHPVIHGFYHMITGGL